MSPDKNPNRDLLKYAGLATQFFITIGLSVFIGIKLDQLSTGMMMVVTGVGLLVHIFSLAYMKDDEGKARYFGGLSLFMFSMTGIPPTVGFYAKLAVLQAVLDAGYLWLAILAVMWLLASTRRSPR